MPSQNEQLIPDAQEQRIRQEEKEPDQEIEPVLSSVGVSQKTEAQVALDITKRILGEMASKEGKFEKSDIYQEVERILKSQLDQKIESTVAEKEDLYKYFISGGRRALEQELYYLQESSFSRTEKLLKKEKLLEDYANSKIIEKMAVTETIESLLGKFLNPYVKAKELADLTNSKQNKEGTWISDLNFDSVKKGCSSFMSQKSREEICAGIQYALAIKQNNEALVKKHKGYDGRPNAKAIIRDFFGYELKGMARVVSEGPLSITIVVNEKDYEFMNGESGTYKSGGTHFSPRSENDRVFGNKFLKFNFTKEGCSVNLCKSYESLDIINHENEHSLYDILAFNRGKKGDILSSLPDLLKKSPENPEKFVDKTVEELLFEADNRRISHFANEVMAYVLNNEDPNTSTLKIVESTMMRLLDTDLYERHKLDDQVLERMRSQVISKLTNFQKVHSEDDLMRAFIDQCREKIQDVVTLEKMKKEYESIIETVSWFMKTYPDRKNYIRALLAGENPLKWNKIARTEFDLERVHKKYKGSVEANEEEIVYNQLNAVEIFLELIGDGAANKAEERDMQSIEKSELKREVILSLDEYQNVVDVFGSSSGKIYLIIEDKHVSDQTIINSSGKNIFNRVLHGFYRIIDAGGRAACRARINEIGSKAVILVQGEKRAIGNEFRKTGNPIFYQGKIIFPAMKDNGLWQIVNEDGNPLSDEHDNIDRLRDIGSGFYFTVRKLKKYRECHEIINDEGKAFESEEEFDKYKKERGIVEKLYKGNLETKEGEVSSTHFLNKLSLSDKLINKWLFD